MRGLFVLGLRKCILRSGGYSCADCCLCAAARQLAIVIGCGMDDRFFRVDEELHRQVPYCYISHDPIVRAGNHSHACWRRAADYSPFSFASFSRTGYKNVTTLLDDTTASSHRSGGCLSVRNDMPAASPANMRYIAVVGTKEVKIASSCRINKNSPPICSILRSRSGVFTSRWSCWHARSSCRSNRPYSRDIHERSCCGFECR